MWNYLKKKYYTMTQNSEKQLLLRLEQLRQMGMTIGKDCRMVSDIFCDEPYLVSVGDNVTFSSQVALLTHDNSVTKIIKRKTDVFGKINIGNNNFIGFRVTILPGVTLGDNVICAAGSVVTKSFCDNVIIGGNPAKIIRSIDDNYRSSIEKVSLDTIGMDGRSRRREIMRNLDKLIEK
jgi:maltose O-acetyltransferase